VALVQIYDAGLKRAARGSLKYRTQKLPKIATWAQSQNLSEYIFATKACIGNRKKNLLNSNISPTCLQNLVNPAQATSCSMGIQLPQFSFHVYCGQAAGWMKTPLGTEVELGSGTLC